MRRLFVASALAPMIALAGGYFDGYQTPESLNRQLFSLAQTNPQLLRVAVLTDTPGKHQVLQATLGKQSDAPAVAVVAGLEGDDLAGAPVCLRFIERMCRDYGRVDSVTALLDRAAFYIFPSMNPDAAAQLHRKPVCTRTVNARPTDDDCDGAVDEDGYEDLNGDGRITQMRVASPFGEWLADPQTPVLMRRADPSQQERGEFCLYGEGVDNDGDGNWNEDSDGGVDLGRNFAYDYRPFTRGAGEHPMSEAETRALADFFSAHPNIFAVFSFSSHDNLLQPWQAGKSLQEADGKPLTAPLPEDAPYFRRMSERFRAVVPSQPLPHDEPSSGTFCQWAYHHFGRWSFSAPVWLPPADSALVKETGDPFYRQRLLYTWLTANGHDRQFVPWQAVEHPDFPGQRVEVGGFAPLVEKNPPSDSLEVIAARYGDFFIELAGAMPIIEETLLAEKLHDALCRLTLRVVNRGRLPTAGKLGDEVQWLRKVKAEIMLDKEQTLVSGTRFYLLESIEPGRWAEKSWVVRAKRGRVRVRVGSPSVGSVEAEARL